MRIKPITSWLLSRSWCHYIKLPFSHKPNLDPTEISKAFLFCKYFVFNQTHAHTYSYAWGIVALCLVGFERWIETTHWSKFPRTATGPPTQPLPPQQCFQTTKISHTFRSSESQAELWNSNNSRDIIFMPMNTANRMYHTINLYFYSSLYPCRVIQFQESQTTYWERRCFDHCFNFTIKSSPAEC